MALSTLRTGTLRRFWCSLGTHGAVPRHLTLFRHLTYRTMQIRGFEMPPVTRLCTGTRCLATQNHKNDQKQNNWDQRESKRKSAASKWGLGSIAIGASFVYGKAKYVLVGLKLAKFAPLASMVLSSFAYSFFFGWPYAIGMVGLIAIHESGHAIALRYYGIPFSPAVFIPFMGAVISMKGQPKNVLNEAVIAIAGPLVGSAGAAAVAICGAVTGSQLCLALADFGFMINLFNMLPIGSLDGGRISSALSPWLNVAGLGAGGLLIYAGYIHNPIFYIIMFGGVYTAASRFMQWEGVPHPSYYNIGSDQRLMVGAAYVGLIGALLLAMRLNNGERKTPRQLEQEANRGDDVDIEWSTEDVGVEDHGVKYDDFTSQIFSGTTFSQEDDSYQLPPRNPSESYQSHYDKYDSPSHIDQDEDDRAK